MAWTIDRTASIPTIALEAMCKSHPTYRPPLHYELSATKDGKHTYAKLQEDDLAVDKKGDDLPVDKKGEDDQPRTKAFDTMASNVWQKERTIGCTTVGVDLRSEAIFTYNPKGCRMARKLLGIKLKSEHGRVTIIRVERKGLAHKWQLRAGMVITSVGPAFKIYTIVRLRHDLLSTRQARRQQVSKDKMKLEDLWNPAEGEDALLHVVYNVLFDAAQGFKKNIVLGVVTL